MSDCPADNALTAFVEGRISDEAAAGVHAHVDRCAACRGLLAAIARGGSPAAAPTQGARSADSALDGSMPPSENVWLASVRATMAATSMTAYLRLRGSARAAAHSSATGYEKSAQACHRRNTARENRRMRTAA